MKLQVVVELETEVLGAGGQEWVRGYQRIQCTCTGSWRSKPGAGRVVTGGADWNLQACRTSARPRVGQLCSGCEGL